MNNILTKKTVFLLSLLSFIFVSCSDDNESDKYYMDAPVYSEPTQYLGEFANKLDSWFHNQEELYHVRIKDQNELFLFDCVATYRNPRLISGFEFSNLSSGDYSAITAKGVRTNSYVTYRYNPNLEKPAEPIRVSFREVGDSSKSKTYKVSGLYVTNTTIACNAMREGDDYIERFGQEDWFKLTIYNNDKTNKVEVMLASENTLVNTWKFIKLDALGHTDGLIFELSSSVGDIAQIPSLSYFCLDGIVIE